MRQNNIEWDMGWKRERVNTTRDRNGDYVKRETKMHAPTKHEVLQRKGDYGTEYTRMFYTQCQQQSLCMRLTSR